MKKARFSPNQHEFVLQEVSFPDFYVSENWYVVHVHVINDQVMYDLAVSYAVQAHGEHSTPITTFATCQLSPLV
jgi:hypothetical protein